MKTLNKIPLVLLAVCVIGFTGSVDALAAGPAVVNLGSAGGFAVLAKTGISTTGTTLVTGNIGVSPAAATFITGFGLNLPAGSAFATSPLVVGSVYAPGYANPTPATMTTAISDMEAAYTDAAGRANPTATELGAGNIGGLTIAPGLYKWGTSVAIPSSVTLSGGANDVWIFQIAQNLNVSSAASVILSGGAQASNVFWVIGGQATIGTTAVFNGTILGQTAIVLQTGARLNGRALAQSAVTLDASSVTVPSFWSVATINSAPTPIYNPVYTTTSASPSANNVTVNYNTAVPAAQQSYQAGQLMPALGTAGYGATLIVNPAPPALFQPVRMIAVNLAEGSRNNDVGTLQQFLISQNRGPEARALANVGATSYFGLLTRAALAEFQANVGISPALGNFGPITRAYISGNY